MLKELLKNRGQRDFHIETEAQTAAPGVGREDVIVYLPATSQGLHDGRVGLCGRASLGDEAGRLVQRLSQQRQETIEGAESKVSQGTGEDPEASTHWKRSISVSATSRAPIQSRPSRPSPRMPCQVMARPPRS